MEFTKWIDKIWTGITEFIEFLFELPNLLINLLSILPSEIQVIFISGLAILIILLIYRFIK